MATASERLKRFLANGGRCYLCGRKIETWQKWHDEHVKPKGLKGSNDLSNRKPAHIDCHAVKTRHDVAIMRKADRQGKKHLGLKRAKRPMPGSRASKWKCKIGGGVERRST